jgi:predicted transcriptional regulator
MYTHRLQLLLDDDRYDRVTALARQRHTSVATVIREAIDRGLPAVPRRRSAAGKRILAAPAMPVGDPAELRAELDELRGRHG